VRGTRRGFTIIEVLITVSVMGILMALATTFVKASTSDRKERAAVDALANMITSATRQAAATNTNMVLQVSGTTARVMRCANNCMGGLTPVDTLDPLDFRGLMAGGSGNLLGFRSDGIVAFSGNLPGIFNGLAWTDRTVLPGRNQTYLLQVTRYGDAVVCDGRVYTTCPSAVTR